MKRKLWLCGVLAVSLIAAALIFSSCDNGECAHENLHDDHYEYNEEGHWQYCDDCHAEVNFGEHDFEYKGELVNCDYEQEYSLYCKACGCHIYKMFEPVGHNVVDGQCTRCEQGFYFELNDDGQSYKVAGYSSLDQSTEISVEIPSSFRGLPVTVIGNGLFNFYGERELVSVTIPDSITVIEDRAFQNAKITEITIPDGVTTIGDSAFAGSSITSLTLPDSVTTIGDNAFCGTPIVSLTLPSGEVTIGGSAFAYCKSLTAITLSDGVVSVGNDAFARCTAVKELTLGKNLTSVGDRAFFGLSSLEKVYYNCKAITGVGRYVMWGFGPGAGEVITSDYYYPEAQYELYIVDDIDYYATALTNDYEQISKIHVSSIEFWMGLATAEVSAEGVCVNNRQPVGSEGLFIDGEAITEIIIPESFTSVIGHFRNCKSVKNIVIHDGVTFVDTGAFRELSGVESLTIGAGVTYAGELAFGELVSLKELYFNATDLSDYSIHYTSGSFVNAGMETEGGYTLYIGEGVKSIPDALSSSNIGVAKLPSINVIMESGFGALSAAKEIEIAGGFDGVLVIPEDVTVIPDYAFSSWSGVTAIVLHSGITEIGYDAFRDCENLISVEGLPAGVNIKAGAFWGTNLSEITIPENAYVGANAFVDAGLTKVVLSDGVEVANEAFKANAIENMIFGDDVTLHDYALNYASIKYWEFNGDSYNFDDYAFYMSYGEEQWDHITVNVGANMDLISDFEQFRPINSLEFGVDLGDYCRMNVPNGGIFYDKISEERREVSFNGVALGEELIIPDGVTSIGNNVFKGANITSVTIPDSVTSIGDNAFGDCAYLESIKGGANVAYCGANAVDYELIEPVLVGGVYYKFNTIAGIESQDIVSVVIREGTREIPSELFNGCGQLLHVYVPAGCTIGDRAFINTNTDIRIMLGDASHQGSGWKILLEQDGVTLYIGGTYNIQGSSVKLGSIHYSVSYDAESKFAYVYDQYLANPGVKIYAYFGDDTALNIPEEIGGETVTTIADKAFIRLPIKSAYLPETVTKIDEQAFSFCTELESVSIKSVEVVGSLAFYACNVLTSVEMESATHIGVGAFYQCVALQEITIPSTVLYINNGAFQGCILLVSVIFEDTGHLWYIYGSNNVKLDVTDRYENAENLVNVYGGYGWIIDSEVDE